MKIFVFINFVLISSICYAQAYEVGESYFHDNDYIEYIHGNLPVIISVPHGGEKTPNSIPDRICDTCIVLNDSFTQELSRLVIENIHNQTGCYPHVIINRLHRKKLDANREINEATLGNIEAENAWEFYQKYIEKSKTFVSSNYSKGIFIDLHGHAHQVQRLELGYLISKTKLMLSENDLDDGNCAHNSSIKHLSENNLNDFSFSELLRGQSSLGFYISNFGFPAVPSPSDPFPLANEDYFSGGYNTKIHGSESEGKIDAIQIECNQDVRFNETTRVDFAEALAESLVQYLETHYIETISEEACGLVDLEEIITQEIKLYPNPFFNYFEIEIPNTIDEILIYNGLGKAIYKSNITNKNQKIDLSNYPNGIYMVVGLNNHNNIFNQKVIKTN